MWDDDENYFKFGSELARFDAEEKLVHLYVGYAGYGKLTMEEAKKLRDWLTEQLEQNS